MTDKDDLRKKGKNVVKILCKKCKNEVQMKKIGISVRNLFFPTFVIQFLNQVIPSATVSGQIFFIQYLKKL